MGGSCACSKSNDDNDLREQNQKKGANKNHLGYDTRMSRLKTSSEVEI